MTANLVMFRPLQLHFIVCVCVCVCVCACVRVCVCVCVIECLQAYHINHKCHCLNKSPYIYFCADMI